MKKKVFLSILIILCLLICLSAFFACSQDTPESDILDVPPSPPTTDTSIRIDYEADPVLHKLVFTVSNLDASGAYTYAIDGGKAKALTVVGGKATFDCYANGRFTLSVGTSGINKTITFNYLDLVESKDVTAKRVDDTIVLSWGETNKNYIVEYKLNGEKKTATPASSSYTFSLENAGGSLDVTELKIRQKPNEGDFGVIQKDGKNVAYYSYWSEAVDLYALGQVDSATIGVENFRVDDSKLELKWTATQNALGYYVRIAGDSVVKETTANSYSYTHGYGDFTVSVQAKGGVSGNKLFVEGKESRTVNITYVMPVNELGIKEGVLSWSARGGCNYMVCRSGKEDVTISDAFYSINDYGAAYSAKVLALPNNMTSYSAYSEEFAYYVLSAPRLNFHNSGSSVSFSIAQVNDGIKYKLRIIKPNGQEDEISQGVSFGTSIVSRTMDYFMDSGTYKVYATADSAQTGYYESPRSNEVEIVKPKTPVFSTVFDDGGDYDNNNDSIKLTFDSNNSRGVFAVGGYRAEQTLAFGENENVLSVPFDSNTLADTAFTLQIYAKGDGNTLLNSDKIELKVERPAIPSGLALDGQTRIAWRENGSYDATLDSVKKAITGTTVSHMDFLGERLLGAGEHSFYLRRSGTTESSTALFLAVPGPYSTVMKFTKLNPVSNLRISERTLTWDVPQAATGSIVGYKVNDNSPVNTAAFAVPSATVSTTGSVFAVRTVGDISKKYLDSDPSTFTAYKLATPQVSISNGKLSWLSVDFSDRYFISDADGSLLQNVTNTTEFGLENLRDKLYNVTVEARNETNGKYYPSDPSVIVTFGKYPKPVLVIKESLLSWAATAAGNYAYKFDNEEFTPISQNEIDLGKRVIPAGVHRIVIKSIGNEQSILSSDESTAITFIKLAKPSLSMLADVITVGGLQEYTLAYSYSLNGGNAVEVAKAAQNTYALDKASLAVARHTFTCIAVGNGSSEGDATATISSDSTSYNFTKLPAPTLNMTNSVLSIIAGGTDNGSYGIVLDNKAPLVQQSNEYAVDQGGTLVGGAHDIAVYAVGDGVTTVDSNSSEAYSFEKYATPTPVINNSVLTWATTVTENYRYSFNGGAEVPLNEARLNLAALTLAANTYTVTVRALGDGTTKLTSNTSTALTFIKLSAPVLTMSDSKIAIVLSDDTAKYSYQTDTGDVFTQAKAAINTFSVDVANNAPGAHVFYCTAVGNGSSAGEVTATISSVRSSCSYRKLNAPTLSMAGGIMSVTAVGVDEGSYTLLLNNVTLATINSAEYTVDSAGTLSSGEYVMSAFAVGDGTRTVNSNLAVGYTFEKLAAPTLTLQDSVLRWSAPAAFADTTYTYTINNGSSKPLTAPSLDLSTLELSSGANAFIVTAVGNGVTSLTSAPSSAFSATKLAAPVPQMSDSVISWSAVTNCTEGYFYRLIKGGETVVDYTEISALSYTPDANGTLSAGEYSLQLSAKGNGSATLDSVKTSIAFTKLSIATPTMQNGTVSWTQTANCSGYSYSIDDGENTETAQASLPLSVGDYTVGAHTVTLRAVGNGSAYINSSSVTLTFTRLADTSVSYSAGSFSWTAVQNATDYYCYFNAQPVNRTGLTYTINPTQLSAGAHAFTVVPVKDTYYLSNTAKCDITKLSAPTALTFNNSTGRLSWSADVAAAGYSVTVGEATYTVTQNHYDVSLSIAAGSYVCNVKAFSEDGTVIDSNVGTDLTVTKLATPVNFTRDGAKLVWSAGDGFSTNYLVELAESNYQIVGATEYALPSLSAGVHNYTVKAESNGANVITSQPATLTLRKLSAPTGISFSKLTGVLTWNAGDEYCSTYQVNLNGAVNTQSVTTVTLPLTVDSGNYDYTLVALSTGTTVLDSAPATFRVIKLATPSALNYAKATGALTWAAVSGTGISYTVKNNGAAVGADVTTESVTVSTTEAGSYTVVAHSTEANVIDSAAASLAVTKLAAPTTLAYDKATGALSWAAVSGTGISYTVKNNGVAVEDATNADTTVTVSTTEAGSYTVVAHSTEANVIDSAAASLTVTKLATPTTLAYDKATGALTWAAVSGTGISYTVKNNGVAVEDATNTDTTATVSTTEAGSYTVVAHSTEANVIDSAAASLAVTKLATPTTLAYDKATGALTWAIVVGTGISYTVKNNGVAVEDATDTDTTVTVSTTEAGNYTVVAHSTEANVIDSAAASLAVTQLATPTTLAYDKTTGALSWAAVSGTGISYTVKNNGAAVGADVATESVIVSTTEAGSYTVVAHSTEANVIDSAAASLTVTKLATPTTLAYDKATGALTWAFVVGTGISYTVKNNGVAVEDATDTDTTVTVSTTEAGSYTVVAHSTEANVIDSAAASLEVTKLATPTELAYDAESQTLSWAAVTGEGNVTYRVCCDGLLEGTADSTTLSLEGKAAGTYSYTVVAVSSGETECDSAESTAVSVTI